MFFIAMEKWLDDRTRFAFAAVPCQLSTSMRLPLCAQRMAANYGVGQSVSTWILNTVLAQGASSEALVSHFDLLNRTQVSRRCRPILAALVSKLAPRCLPGPQSLWSTDVNGRRVWEDLRPRDAPSFGDANLDLLVPELITFAPIQLGDDSWKRAFGYLRNSRYDLDVALPAAASAYRLGALLLRASNRALGRDAQRVVTVSLLSPYKGMCSVLQEAALVFIQKLSPRVRGCTDFMQRVQIKVMTCDSVHGDTLDAAVLALPCECYRGRLAANQRRPVLCGWTFP